jgi:hypothetical protein
MLSTVMLSVAMLSYSSLFLPVRDIWHESGLNVYILEFTPAYYTFIETLLQSLGPYSQNFVFFVSYKFAQQASVLHCTRLERLGTDNLDYWAYFNL